MPRIATPRAYGRKPWQAVPMRHYHRSLVLGGRVPFPQARKTRFLRILDFLFLTEPEEHGNWLPDSKLNPEEEDGWQNKDGGKSGSAKAAVCRFTILGEKTSNVPNATRLLI